jgi:riboflavin biosynthesis pyrimidine reductase
MWSDRFNAFVERKLREAHRAQIDGLITVEDRSSTFALESIGSAWTQERFDGRFHWSTREDGRSLNLVFVQSREGNTVAQNPSALGGGDTDKHLIYEGLSRAHVDAVLAGANTVVGSDLLFSVWHPELVDLRTALGKPRHPTQIVVSIRHAVTVREELIFNVPAVPAILITTDVEADAYAQSAARRPWVHVIGTGMSIDMSRALDILAREHGLSVISCVGGRTTATALIDAGVVDDLYLTTSPQPGGEPNTPLYDEPLSASLIVRKHGRSAEANVIFEHWRLQTIRAA